MTALNLLNCTMPVLEKQIHANKKCQEEKKPSSCRTSFLTDFLTDFFYCLQRLIWRYFPERNGFLAAFPLPWNIPFLAHGLAEANVRAPLIPARDDQHNARQVEQAPQNAPLDQGQGQGQGRDRRRQNLLLRGLDFANIIHGRLRPRP